LQNPTHLRRTDRQSAWSTGSFDREEQLVVKRVNRGGSFLCDAAYCASYRPASRMKTNPDSGSSIKDFAL